MPLVTRRLRARGERGLCGAIRRGPGTASSPHNRKPRPLRCPPTIRWRAPRASPFG